MKRVIIASMLVFCISAHAQEGSRKTVNLIIDGLKYELVEVDDGTVFLPQREGFRTQVKGTDGRYHNSTPKADRPTINGQDMRVRGFYISKYRLNNAQQNEGKYTLGSGASDEFGCKYVEKITELGNRISAMTGLEAGLPLLQEWLYALNEGAISIQANESEWIAGHEYRDGMPYPVHALSAGGEGIDYPYYKISYKPSGKNSDYEPLKGRTYKGHYLTKMGFSKEEAGVRIIVRGIPENAEGTTYSVFSKKTVNMVTPDTTGF